MADGEVVFEVRADDSNLESDIRKAEQIVRKAADGVEEAVSEIGEAAEEANKRVSDSAKKAGEETEGLGESSEKTRRKMKSFSEELDDVNKLLEKDRKNTELLAQKKAVLTKAVSETSDKLKELEKRTEDVNTAYGKGDIPIEEYREFQREIIKTKQELKDYEEQLKNVGTKKDSFTKGGDKSSFTSDVASEAGINIPTGKAALVAGAVTGGIAVVGTAVSAADNLDKAVDRISSSLGLMEDEAEKYEEIIKEIYGNNFGDSFEDVAQKIALVKEQMKDLSGDELQKAVESAYMLSDVYDIDISESIRGADAMAEQFGISVRDAYNLMAQGAEKGLNQNGDLADQLAEYSVYYADMGLSAKQALAMLIEGAQDGVYQIDYLNDAIKEFSIKTKDGSDSTAEGFKLLGLDAETMTRMFAAGGEQAAEAFKTVNERLAECDDDVNRNAAGVALYGTKWEDLGEDAVLAMAEIGDHVDLTRDKLGEMEEIKYSNLSDMLSGLARTLEMLLIPLGEALIPILHDVVMALTPVLEDLLPPVMNLLSKLITPLIQIVEKLLPPLLEVNTAILLILDPFVDIIAIFLDLIVALCDPIGDIISLIATLITEFISFRNDGAEPVIKVLEWLIEILTKHLCGALNTAVDMFSALIKFMKGDFVGGIQDAANGFLNAFSTVFATIDSLLGTKLQEWYGKVTDFFKGFGSYIYETLHGDEINQAELEQKYSGMVGRMSDTVVKNLRAGMSAEEALKAAEAEHLNTSEKQYYYNNLADRDKITLEEVEQWKENIKNAPAHSEFSTTDSQKRAGYYTYNGLSEEQKNALFNSNAEKEKPTDGETPEAKELRDLRFRHDIGELSDEEYYNLYEAYRDKYYSSGSKEWQSATVDIYNYRNKKPASSSSGTKAETKAEKELRDLKYQHDMGYISDDEYYSSYAEYRDKYYEEGSKEWQAANVAIRDYEESKNSPDNSGFKKSESDSKNDRRTINITSYIPTVWDTEEEANKKLEAAIGIESMGGSTTGKIVEGLTDISTENTASHLANEENSEKTLSDVVRSIDKLAETDTKRKISLDVDLYARDLLIGTVAYEDINDITLRDGKSPLIG